MYVMYIYVYVYSTRVAIHIYIYIYYCVCMYNTYIYIYTSSHEVGGTGSLHPHFPCPYWSTPHEFDGQQLTTAQNFRMTTAEFLVHDHNVGR